MPRAGTNLLARDRSRGLAPLSSSDRFLFDVVLVDLMLGDFVRGRGGAGADAEEEAEVEVAELALELADDAASVADEGSGEGEDGAGVA